MTVIKNILCVNGAKGGGLEEDPPYTWKMFNIYISFLGHLEQKKIKVKNDPHFPPYKVEDSTLFL